MRRDVLGLLIVADGYNHRMTYSDVIQKIKKTLNNTIIKQKANQKWLSQHQETPGLFLATSSDFFNKGFSVAHVLT